MFEWITEYTDPETRDNFDSTIRSYLRGDIEKDEMDSLMTDSGLIKSHDLTFPKIDLLDSVEMESAVL